jgi:DNA-binding NarL/FixJ family response regulator
MMTEKNIRVFIVDDHQIMIDGIKSMLAHEKGLTIVGHANNGKLALSLLENLETDVILMDIEMPVMNGIDATRIITAKYPSVKIIVLSTYDEKSLVKTMFDAGAKGYVLKNINREILVEAIITVAEGGVYQGTDVLISMARKPVDGDREVKYGDSVVSQVLSQREIDVLKHIVSGLSSKDIAEQLFISPKTVETHRNNIMKKLNVHNIASLVKYAVKAGIVD